MIYFGLRTENDKIIYDKNSSTGVFMVSGPVDSQNGFGSLIRSYYCAEMFKGVDGWKIWKINIREQPYLSCNWVEPIV